VGAGVHPAQQAKAASGNAASSALAVAFTAWAWAAGLYFSKKDTRAWVPKSIPWTGWTLNLGTRAGARWMIGLLIGLPLFMILLMSLVVRR
jgi:hypothetical protein